MSGRTNAGMAVAVLGRTGGGVVRETRAALAETVRRRPRRARRAAPTTAFDPLAPEVVADPYPSYRALHASGPLHYAPRRRVWVISGYDEVRAASRAHDVFSSAQSVTLYRSSLPMLLTMDRPEHARLRAVVARDFTRDAVAVRRPAIERLASEAFDDLLAPEDGDALAQLAAPLPVAVIAQLLGVPAADLPEFRRLSDRIVEGFAVEPGIRGLAAVPGVISSVVRLHAYFAAELERPGDGLLHGLRDHSEAGSLEPDELFWFALLLLVAGNETTTNLIGTMLLALAQRPAVYERLRADPGLVPAAVEEALRHTSPIQGLYRTAVRDHAIDAVTIPAGARVLLLFGAANRDPRHYPDPDVFSLDRHPSDHLGFGSGIHFCLGAHLARLEAAVVLLELVARVRAIELAGEPAWRDNPTLRGLSRLPLRLVPA
jgi:beta-dihydromenaquinone-9 omega-hydroxylase